MKQLIYFFTSIIILTGFISCKKNFVCTCTTTITEPDYTHNGSTHYGSTNVVISQETYKEKKEAAAESRCLDDEFDMSYSSPNENKGQGLTTELKTCELNKF